MRKSAGRLDVTVTQEESLPVCADVFKIKIFSNLIYAFVVWKSAFRGLQCSVFLRIQFSSESVPVKGTLATARMVESDWFTRGWQMIDCGSDERIKIIDLMICSSTKVIAEQEFEGLCVDLGWDSSE